MPEEDSDDDHVGLSTMLLSATDGNESGGTAEEIEMIPISLHEYEWKKESSKQDTQDGPASSFSSVVNLTNTILGAGMLGMARAIQSSGLILGTETAKQYNRYYRLKSFFPLKMPKTLSS